MRVIPVIDLMGGLVVRGVAGRRSEYRPIESCIAEDAQPETVARAFVSQFGFDAAYVADLDAILQGKPNVAAWQQMAATGLKLWLDAGIGDSEITGRMLEHIARTGIDVELVVGLESLESEAELEAISEVCGHKPPIFSLDMKNGSPLVSNPGWREWSPLEFVSLALSAGLRDVIVLDLADVGTGGGTRTLDLCREIRQSADVRMLIAGGGVRNRDDLHALESAGCDAAMVASALHDGRLTPREIGQAGRLSC